MSLAIDDAMSQFNLPDLQGALADFFQHDGNNPPLVEAIKQLMQTLNYCLITFISE